MLLAMFRAAARYMFREGSVSPEPALMAEIICVVVLETSLARATSLAP
jgi:hypothetical protein